VNPEGIIIALLSVLCTLMLALFAAFLQHTRSCQVWRDRLNVEHGKLLERTGVDR